MAPPLEMNDPVETLKILSECLGVSGFEDIPRQIVHDAVTPLVDKVWVDPLGNLLAIKKGKRASGPRILLDAHLDEVGFIIKHVDEQGFLFFDLLGGWDERVLPGHQVLLRPHQSSSPLVSGVIGMVPPHLSNSSERDKTIPAKALYIDIGATSKADAEKKGITIGSSGTLSQAFTHLSSTRVLGKAFDDRGGCTVILHVLKHLQESPIAPTVVVNFAVAEELGARGAGTGAYTLEPDAALAIETTTAADIPTIGSKDCPTYLDKGPAITIADRSLIAHPQIVKRVTTTATKAKIPWQYKKPLTGGTDAGRIHLIRGGIPTGVISMPCRYIHSPVSILSTNDLRNTITLVTKVLQTWT